MQELEKIMEEINAEFDRHIGTRLKIIAGTNDDVYRYGYGKSLEAYQQGKLFVEDIIRKHMNDGWIPVEERLPEEKKSVLVQWEKYDRHLNVTLTYLDVMWLEDEEDVVFETINGIPNGRVIAWRPLPEPYQAERSMK
ncbi:DUF551 domain-containing protein [Sellimonas caecigallum]|uniref:DUF551 domain-containing protein n=1 Tax=Sellimonas caecigallum TaxID=2592333 RepID=A0ABS7L651_9FIRM|nr:DUF551 domain-containing protein [Sellimonas caecigallum]MBY0758541.1 DUF551 domain-containing protein [Sellimonas caecigallum]